ncbi:hypothetical protein [Cytophaga sp. FL35]|uniref:hypothetical protein n=1 Tax=Cytophaga sp. FL35 TaxID=1904456 RepID=UPI001653E603|nr:hypothetical protein [Cytophaga sp. FL35]MBC7000718.1 hypothetical protein [Cytophaga sp. FL35]
MDTDGNYWEGTGPPWRQKIPLEKRNQALKKDANVKQNSIFNGSLMTLGKSWLTIIDLAYLSVWSVNEGYSSRKGMEWAATAQI